MPEKWEIRYAVTPGFLKNKTRLIIYSYVCPESPHICQNEKVSEIMLLYNVYIAILTLTSEYGGIVTKLQASFFSGTADWGLRIPNTSKRFLETPLPLYPSSEQHLITHWGVGEIARVSPCQTQQVQHRIHEAQKTRHCLTAFSFYSSCN
jgi:hypothetical protein